MAIRRGHNPNPEEKMRLKEMRNLSPTKKESSQGKVVTARWPYGRVLPEGRKKAGLEKGKCSLWSAKTPVWGGGR